MTNMPSCVSNATTMDGYQLADHDGLAGPRHRARARRDGGRITAGVFGLALIVDAAVDAWRER